MKKIKIIDEDTLEIKEFTIGEDKDGTDYTSEEVVQALQKTLNYDPEDFYKKYKKMKKAEEEFNAIYEPFKEQLLSLYESGLELPKNIVVGGTKLTYVSPSIRNTIDSKKLKEEEPEIAKKFTKTSAVKATIRLEEI